MSDTQIAPFNGDSAERADKAMRLLYKAVGAFTMAFSDKGLFDDRIAKEWYDLTARFDDCIDVVDETDPSEIEHLTLALSDAMRERDDYKEAYEDAKRLTRELDVLLNGEAGAAKQASLCDVVGQVASKRWMLVRRIDEFAVHLCPRCGEHCPSRSATDNGPCRLCAIADGLVAKATMTDAEKIAGGVAFIMAEGAEKVGSVQKVDGVRKVHPDCMYTFRCRKTGMPTPCKDCQ